MQGRHLPRGPAPDQGEEMDGRVLGGQEVPAGQVGVGVAIAVPPVRGEGGDGVYGEHDGLADGEDPGHPVGSGVVRDLPLAEYEDSGGGGGGGGRRELPIPAPDRLPSRPRDPGGEVPHRRDRNEKAGPPVDAGLAQPLRRGRWARRRAGARAGGRRVALRNERPPRQVDGVRHHVLRRPRVLVQQAELGHDSGVG